jgi:hypothetical protein
MGAHRCFQHIEVTLTFDAKHRMIDKSIAGGSFVKGQA